MLGPDLSPERYRRLQAEFEAARELTGDARRDRVERLRAEDPELVDPLLALLAADEACTEPIRRELDLAVSAEGGEFAPGAAVGAYTILSRIGAGGYGSVYRASQREPVRRDVAIKVLHAGLHSSAVIARFRAEQQTLALMDHPGIARIFDAGVTSDGRPYFVMQLVSGQPIARHCEARSLPIDERLRLVRGICDALHHAHVKGVVHRDLKPSNILVAEESGIARAVIIDFGIAKALQPSDEFALSATTAGQPIGTWAYMSPEQAEGRADVDTRSDIYSLGVVLYELLTGSRPFDDELLRKAGHEGIRRILREVDPPTPSSRALPSERTAQLRRDLEWIPLRAMEKEPSRRYQSALALAEDIDNYLAGRPLVARAASRVYRTRKFIRRHRFTVVAATLLLLSLLGGIVGTTLGFLEASDRAEGEAAAADREREARAQADRSSREAEAERDRSEAIAYRSNLAAAQAFLDIGNVRLVRDHLDACPMPRQASWEWRHLNARSSTARASAGNRYGILNVAFLGSSHRFAANSWTQEVVVREVDVAPGASGLRELLRTVAFRSAVRHGLGVDAEGGLIASTTVNGGVHLWAPPNSDVLTELNGHSRPPRVIRFSPDGAKLLTVSPDGTLRVWSRATGESLLVLNVQRKGESRAADRELHPSSGAWSPDGARIATTDGPNGPALWDAASGERLRDLPLASMTADGLAPLSSDVAFALGGSLILVGADDGIVRMFDGGSGEPRGTLDGQPVRGQAFAVSPAGDLVAAASGDGGANVWRLADRTRVASIGRCHAAGVVALSFTVDGAELVTADSNGVVALWNIRDQRSASLPLVEHRASSSDVSSLALSRDGRWIVAGANDGTIHLFDGHLRGPSASIPNAPPGGLAYSIAWHPSGDRFAIGDLNGWVTVHDGFSGRTLASVQAHRGMVGTVEWRGTGDELVTAGDTSIGLWKMSKAATGPSGELSLVRRIDIGGLANRAVLGHDAATVFAPVTNRPRLRAFRLDDGTSVLDVAEHLGAIMGIAASADGALVATWSRDTSVMIRDGSSGAMVRVIGTPLAPPAGSAQIPEGCARAAFDRAGRRIAVVTEQGELRVHMLGDGSVTCRVQLPGAGQLLGMTAGLIRWIDEDRVATGRGPLGIVVDVRSGAVTGLERRRATSASILVSLAATPEGDRIATVEGDPVLRLWDPRGGEPLLELDLGPELSRAVAFSPDGSRLLVLTGREGERARLLDTEVRKPVE